MIFQNIQGPIIKINNNKLRPSKKGLIFKIVGFLSNKYQEYMYNQ